MSELALAACPPELPSTLSGAPLRVYRVEKNCNSASGCVTDIRVAGTCAFERATPTAPIRVDIGPGTFEYDDPTRAPLCKSTAQQTQGYVTFKGAGNEQSIITAKPGGGYALVEAGDPQGTFVLKMVECKSVTFQDLKILNLTVGQSLDPSNLGVLVPSGILWRGAGSSNWVNMKIDVLGTGWWDVIAPSPPAFPAGTKNEHYWYNSVIRANPNASPYAWYYMIPFYPQQTSETWFYGGRLEATRNTGSVSRMLAVFASNGADIHLFGTSIRVVNLHPQGGVSTAWDGFGTANAGLGAEGGAVIHAHGSQVYVRSAFPDDTTCMGAGTASAMIHAPGTSYDVDCGGTARRLANSSGMIHSPYWWGSNPPNPQNIRSLKGQDMFVEQVCVSGACTSQLMIYREVCTGAGGPWFNVYTKQCRS